MNFPDIRQLIPQRPPAVVLDRVIDFSPPFCTSEVTLDETFPYFEEGKVKSILGIEMIAQGIAVFVALSRMAGEAPGKPRNGYIVSVTSAEFEQEFFPLGVPLRVAVEEIWSQGPAGNFAGTIFANERLLVSAKLSVIESESPP